MADNENQDMTLDEWVAAAAAAEETFKNAFLNLAEAAELFRTNFALPVWILIDTDKTED